MEQYHILVIGCREGLISALERLNIPYSIWNDKRVKKSYRPRLVLIDSIVKNREKIKKNAAYFSRKGITHVIAGTEKSVYPASVLRRLIGARKSKDSVVLRCHDKLLMKSFLMPFGVPMTDFLPYKKGQSGSSIHKKLGEVVVKKRRLSGGRGISFPKTVGEIEALAEKDTYFEKKLEGREGSVESFIQDGKILFSNVTEYLEKTGINLVPSHFDASMMEEMLELNRRVIEALGIEWGMTHLEVFLTSEGIKFGELALRPPGGYIMNLIQLAFGFDAWDSFVKIELGLVVDFPSRPVAFASAHILHPGEGIVTLVRGEKKVCQLENLIEFKLNAKEGDHVEKRVDVGDEVGHILFCCQKKKELLSRIKFVRGNFEIKLK